MGSSNGQRWGRETAFGVEGSPHTWASAPHTLRPAHLDGQPAARMNWNSKEANAVAINSIWSEHVEKEKNYMNPKTKFTCNPMSSIEMNNGLGSRVPFVTDKVGLAQ